MNNIEQTVRDFLVTYDLQNSQEPFLVAFSGGYDSMCLLHTLHSIGLNNIIALHLNHNWRGDESLQEKNHCEEFCKTYGIKFYSEDLSTEVPKTETAARDARYEFFERCAEKFNSKVVFTAHNANDNAETLIYRITKGTGVDGLAGIAPKRDIYYRPILKISRPEIEHYCKEKGLQPNNDSSNSDTTYCRNFIRHNILTALEKINPEVISAINSLSEIARDNSAFLDRLTRYIATSTEKFVSSPETIKKRYIKNILTENGLDYDRAKIELIKEFVKDNSTSKSGKVMSLSSNLQLFVNIGTIKVIEKPNPKNEKEIQINNEGYYSYENKVLSIIPCNECPEKFPPDTENIAYISTDKIDFTLRTRRDGDIFEPIGLNGHQKLKKYLNEKKIPQHKKDSLLFLCRDNEIYWAPGLGISNKIKVTTNVTHVIKLYERNKDEQN